MSDTNVETRMRDAWQAADALDRSGQSESATALRAAVGALDSWRRDLVQRTGDALGVHHDIRNALTGILGNAQLLQMGPAAEVTGARKRLDSIVREAERIRDLTERLHVARVALLATSPEENGTKPTSPSEPSTPDAANGLPEVAA